MRPIGDKRVTPVVGSLALAWLVVHVAALFLTGSVSRPGASILYWGAPGQDVLLRLGADQPALVDLGDWQRLITYAFLHGFALHLLLNTWVWWAVGRFLESVIGSSRIWIVFVVASIAGAVAHQLLSSGPVESIPPMVGASGGVFGAVGALGIWSIGSSHPSAPAARGTVLMFVALSLVLLLVPGVAHLGHLGGLAGGVVTMALLGPRRSERPAGVGPKLVAALLLVLVGTAVAVQAGGASTGGHGALLDDLIAAEKLGRRLYDRPDLARPEQRRELGRRLDGLLRDADFDDEDAATAFRAYVEAWRPVADGNVPDPFAFEAARKRAHDAWERHLRRLRLESGRRR